MSKPFLDLLNRLDERRRSGDPRSLNQVAKEIVATLPSDRTRQFVVDLLCQEMLKQWRRKTLTLDPTINEVELPLPFEWPDGVGRYRTSHLVHVNRAGSEDFIVPDTATGKQINDHDRWETFQRKKALRFVEDRRDDNLKHTAELTQLGFDPSTQTCHEMHSATDSRRCVLCGNGPIAGDPWEKEHEQPVSVGVGNPTKLGWAHRSCNRTKGALELAHIVTTP